MEATAQNNIQGAIGKDVAFERAAGAQAETKDAQEVVFGQQRKENVKLAEWLQETMQYDPVPGDFTIWIEDYPNGQSDWLYVQYESTLCVVSAGLHSDADSNTSIQFCALIKIEKRDDLVFIAALKVTRGEDGKIVATSELLSESESASFLSSRYKGGSGFSGRLDKVKEMAKSRKKANAVKVPTDEKPVDDDEEQF